jgi:hypothetical protein
MDRYVIVSQGDVFYMTELLANLEGLERGPAGNTSLAAAFSLSQEMDAGQTIIAQETEYTGAGKHVQPQLSFARRNGIDIRFGDPKDEVPGETIILPESPSLLGARDIEIDSLRVSFIKHAVENFGKMPNSRDVEFLAAETSLSVERAEEIARGVYVAG